MTEWNTLIANQDSTGPDRLTSALTRLMWKDRVVMKTEVIIASLAAGVPVLLAVVGGII